MNLVQEKGDGTAKQYYCKACILKKCIVHLN